ncbi:hypothetical protein ABLO27_14565 [Roseibium sp. SCPC15]|uniref:hypothetical protein n=1 Tax=Roseibium sp. SCP15 TaxID=3141376 RepID=UPI00333BA9BB
MNTHTRITNTSFTSLDDLLELQLDTMAAKANQPKPPGPHDELDIVPATDAATGIMAGAANPADLPFMNLDPYALDGKENLPSGELQEGPQGNIVSEIQSSNGAGEQQLGFGLDMENYTFRTEDGTLDVLALSEQRMTEIKTMNYNGQLTPVEYQSGLAYHFEGNFYDTQLRQLYVAMDAEVATTIQTELFDTNGNPVLTAYGYEQMLNVEGQAFDYGIEEFVMGFEMMVNLERLDSGIYQMTLSVVFEGEIDYLNGAGRDYLFEDEITAWFSDLSEVNVDQFPQGLFDEIARFANGMGEAWDAFGDLNDHLEAILLQLHEDGHYQAWDDAGQGLDNPFDFDLPSIDPFS